MNQLSRAEERLRQAAFCMEINGINAVRTSGELEDGRSFEGLAFSNFDGLVGHLRSSDGRLIEADTEEWDRRLRVIGFIDGVIRPVEKALVELSEEGSTILDQRFDLLTD